MVYMIRDDAIIGCDVKDRLTQGGGGDKISDRGGGGGRGGRGPDLKHDTKLPYIALLYSLVRQREMVPAIGFLLSLLKHLTHFIFLFHVMVSHGNPASNHIVLT